MSKNRDVVGRDTETIQAQRAITKGHNIVVTGRNGIGKSALLDALAQSISDRIVLRMRPVAVRQALLQVAEQLHRTSGLRLSASSIPPKLVGRARLGHKLKWDDIRRPVGRMPVDDLLSTVVRSIESHRAVIVVDSIERPPTYFDVLDQLVQHAQIIAAMDSDNRRNRAVRFVSGFSTRIELRPLTLSASEELIQRHMAAKEFRFTSRRTEQLFVRRVAQEGRGTPSAILGLLDIAGGEDKITPAKVRLLQSDSAIQYIDMTPGLVILLAGVMALRYIGRGIGETELIVISGVGTSLFIVIRFLFFAMRR